MDTAPPSLRDALEADFLRLGVTAKSVAEALDVTPSAISNWARRGEVSQLAQPLLLQILGPDSSFARWLASQESLQLRRRPRRAIFDLMDQQDAAKVFPRNADAGSRAVPQGNLLRLTSERDEAAVHERRRVSLIESDARREFLRLVKEASNAGAMRHHIDFGDPLQVRQSYSSPQIGLALVSFHHPFESDPWDQSRHRAVASLMRTRGFAAAFGLLIHKARYPRAELVLACLGTQFIGPDLVFAFAEELRRNGGIELLTISSVEQAVARILNAEDSEEIRSQRLREFDEFGFDEPEESDKPDEESPRLRGD